MKVGLIGLGIMGRPMGKNLLKRGYDLTVFDLNRSAMDDLRACGADTAGSSAEVGARCDVVLTMLPNSPHVKSVALDEGGLKDTMRPGAVFIDMSSINPIASREIAKALGEKGIAMLDAPVSGGEPKAIDGTLSFMVGGPENVFDQYRELLSAMGSSVVRCGEIGAGNVTKLCNQIVVACNIAAVSEALMLGKKAGVAPEAIYRAIRGGLAASAVMDAKAPMMMDRNFKPGFRIDLHIKDLNNVLDTARSVNSPMLLTNQVFEMMKVLHQDGDGSCDHSALVKVYEKLTGQIITREG